MSRSDRRSLRHARDWRPLRPISSALRSTITYTSVMESKASVGELEQFREYLSLLARMQIGKDNWTRLDASDVVQQALLEAHRKRDQFRGVSDAELAGWLRQILAHTLANAVRALGQAKRDLARERSLQAELDASSARIEAFLVSDQSSPSQRAVRQEEVFRVAKVLAQLPETQREALVLRHCDGLSIDEIAQRLNKGPEAVAGLLKRGLKQLREAAQEA